MKKFIKINEKDNCAVALCDLDAGDYKSDNCGAVSVIEPISRGHKFALRDIATGENIIKYGCEIGTARRLIPKGEHIHTHNLETSLGDAQKNGLSYNPSILQVRNARSASSASYEKYSDSKFMGYLREDGRVGIRNEIWILPLVGCVNDVAKAIAKSVNKELENSKTSWIDGVHAFTHPYGCSQTGADLENTKRILASLAMHPNAAAVLIVSLGCENLTLDDFKDALEGVNAAAMGNDARGVSNAERIKFLVCQESDDEVDEGVNLVKECISYTGKFKREPISLEKLVIGMKCGGSDGLSGITANPTVGRLSDYVTSLGGSVVLTEVPEMFGAEKILLNRCKDEATFDKAADMIQKYKDYFISHGEVVYENPSPGNKAGGISSLEDKSCGCVQKSGTSEVRGILEYGERLHVGGLNLLYGPGNDLVSCTALAAAGCQLVLFTTGRGTPFGTAVPTIKISTNSELYNKKGNWIDFNAGILIDDEQLTIDTVSQELLDRVISYASGEKALNEVNDYREIAIFKDGVIL